MWPSSSHIAADMLTMSMIAIIFLLGGREVSPTPSVEVAESKVRLSNAGNSSFFGRVEVLHRSTWGTICSDRWDLQDAEVVCRQLGFDGAVAAPRYAAFGQGTGQIWLDDVTCVGNETSISQCSHNGWGIHNCRHSSDASVYCNPRVRLVGGSSIRDGVVQVYYNNTWGWVCDDQWEKQDADVLCHMMGFLGASFVPKQSSAMQQSDLILMNNVQCSENEDSLFSCVRGLRNRSCISGFKAGAVCIAPKVRLVAGGFAAYQGRVEIFVGGLWGTVCEDSWDLHDAHTVCRQLGYDGALAAPKEAAFGRGTAALWMSDVQCTGNEPSLSDCWKSRQLFCMESDDASVVCTPPVRLVGGATAREGLLQVYHNNTWGWVCGENWDIQDANVVCRQIGYTRTGQAYVMQSDTVKGNQTVWMNNVQCIGNESSLYSCSHNGWNDHICINGMRAGVKCIGLEVRLTGGNSTRDGGVEVLYNGIWGTVCNLDWDIQDADVVCRELGYLGAEAAVYDAADIYGQGTGAVWMAGADCKGNEASLLKCNHSKVIGRNYCGHDKDAGVICIVPDSVGQPQFISNDLESITMIWNSSRSMTFTVQKWNNDTASWQDTSCYGSTAVGSCMVNHSRATMINLRPSTFYIFRIISRDNITSLASKEMKTKKLDSPGIPFFVSNTLDTITMGWSPLGMPTVTYTINIMAVHEAVWMDATCKESFRPNQCIVTGTTAVVFGLKEDILYRFRVYSNYKGVQSAPSLPSEAWRTENTACHTWHTTVIQEKCEECQRQSGFDLL